MINNLTEDQAKQILQKIADGDDWFDIESAPKDGLKILLKRESEIRIGFWGKRPKHAFGKPYEQNIEMVHTWCATDFPIVYPTHWKPLDGAEHIKMLIERELNDS